jgi:hypothetical protein
MPVAIVAASTWSLRRIIDRLGGDSSVLAIYHALYGVTTSSGNVTNWADARGSSGFGPTLVGGASHLPTFDTTNNLVSFAAGQYATTAASSLFDVSVPISLIGVGIFPNAAGSPIFAEISESASEVRHLALFTSSPNSNKFAAETASTFIAALSTAVGSTTARRLAVASTDNSTNVNIDVPNQARVSTSITGNTNASGNNQLSLGAFFGAAADANSSGGVNIRMVAVINQVVTAAQLTDLLNASTSDIGVVAA